MLSVNDTTINLPQNQKENADPISNCNTRDIILSGYAHKYFTQRVSCHDRQHSTRRNSNLFWVRVHKCKVECYQNLNYYVFQSTDFDDTGIQK